MTKLRKYRKEDTTTAADYACGQQQAACLASGYAKPICDEQVQECMYGDNPQRDTMLAGSASRYGFSDQSPVVWILSVAVVLLIVGAILFMYVR